MPCRLPRIWAMRRSVFGLGALQVGMTGAAFTVLAHLFGAPWVGAGILGFGLALSSTAIVLPLMSERGLLALTSGRDSFAVLLFQDLASIPLIALVPILAGQHSTTPVWLSTIKVVAAIAVILLGGRFLVRPVFKAIGGTRTRELFTATALLIVAGAALIAGCAQISIPLGFTPVPITGQTLGVMLAGAALEGIGIGLFYPLVEYIQQGESFLTRGAHARWVAAAQNQGL
jgi:Kef-type K+ transport system membrane component KefB